MKKICLLITILVIVFNFQACDDFGDMNKNPNAPTSIANNPELLMTYLTRSFPNQMAIEFWSDGGSLMAQYNAKIVFTGFDLFDWGSNSGLWNSLYTYIRNSNNLMEIGHDGYIATATTLRSLMFLILTDLWGDVPYSEAGKAKTDKIYTPKYDTGEFIYTELLKELDKANDLYASNPPGIKGDVLLSGNLTLWRKFNNSIMLRMYMRMSEVRPDVARAGFEKILSNPGKYPILSEMNDNIALNYLAAQPNTWPIHTSRVGSFDENRLSETLESVLKAYDDPRLAAWFRPTENSVQTGNLVWEGMRNGLSDGVAYNYKGGPLNLSRWGRMFFESPNAAQGILMLHSEVEFLIAEAIQRGWISGDQKTHYEKGITSSFEYWSKRAVVAGLTLEMPSDYLTRNASPKTPYNSDFNIPVAYNGSREQILVQKWLANFLNGYEGFHDFCRTGVPNLIKPGPDAQYNQYPSRYIYPASEQALNGANRAEAVSRLSQGDDNRSKVWWQK